MSINMQGQANSSESSANPSNSSSSLGAPRSSSLPDDPYVCCRCLKSFQSPHALGGHQNAHRREKLRDRILEILERIAVRNQTQSPILSAPLGAIPPSDDGQNVSYWASLMAKTFSSHGSMSVFQPGLGFGPENGTGSGSGAKEGYEALSMAPPGNLNYHPYVMPDDKKMMSLDLNQGQESEFAARAGGGAWLGESSNAADADACVGATNGEANANEIDFMKKLDLTLKL